MNIPVGKIESRTIEISTPAKTEILLKAQPKSGYSKVFIYEKPDKKQELLIVYFPW